MAEYKRTDHFDRPGGYSLPKGATQVHRNAAEEMRSAHENGQIRLLGDGVPPHGIEGDGSAATLKPRHQLKDPDTRIYLGDCREVLPNLGKDIVGKVDLVFADPPFNWEVKYDEWADGLPRAEYERFTFDWLSACVDVLAPHGAIWVNIPDDTAAEVVVHLKRLGLTMINWCIWHFRFGQHRDSSFIMSKVHVLYFAKDPDNRTWNPDAVLEMSDRAAIYGDKRTMAKENNKGMRVPMDVWYGQYWGRIQGNNAERRHQHHNQIPEVYLERVIRSCSNENDLVLDPFLGSGTTCTVARELNRRSIGIEYGEANAKSAFERIKAGAVRVKRDQPIVQSTAIFKNRKSQKKKRKTKAQQAT